MDDMKELTADLKMTETGRKLLEEVTRPKKIVAFVPIPEDATVGEVFKIIFPNTEVREHFSYGFKDGLEVIMDAGENSHVNLWFPISLWNASYSNVAPPFRKE